MAGHGRHKVLFGTDFPMILPHKALEGLETLDLDDEACSASRVWRSGHGCGKELAA